MGIRDRLTHAWNAFKGSDEYSAWDIGAGSSSPQHRVITPRLDASTYAATLFNRIAVDTAQVDIRHVKISKDSQNEYKMDSKIQYVLNTEANIDQSNREFIHDIVYSMFSEGVVAVVPVDTTLNPKTGSFDVTTMRTGRITQWFPKHVRVELYNEKTGLKQEVTLPKRQVAIIENPLYAIINGRNSTLKRLTSKLALLDMQDELEATGKLDLIIQLPYVVKGKLKKEAADERIKSIQEQLSGSKYGIAYTDGAEKITQLNRAVTSNLLDEVKYLTTELYNQLGLTENVFNGKADEGEMRNYYARSIDPLLGRITSEFKRKFLTKTAITQGQTFVSHRDPFTLVPIDQVAEIADKFKRNEILTSNEIRPILGFGPSSDPKADEISNPNIANVNQQMYEQPGSVTPPDDRQNGENLEVTEEVQDAEEV